MLSLEEVEPSCDKNTSLDKNPNIILLDSAREQQKKNYYKLLNWISKEDNEFVYLETFSSVQDVLGLLDVIRTAENPILITFFVGNTKHGLVTISLSRVKVDMQHLLFCMFQA